MTLGLGLALLAAVAISTSVLCVRVGADLGASTDAVIVVLLLNVLIVLPLAFLFEAPISAVADPDPVAIASFAMAGLVGTLIGRMFYYASIDRVGASRSEPIKASQPIYATIIAVLLLGETLTAEHFVGILLVVGGVGAISWETASNSRETSGHAYDLLFLFAASFFYGVEPVFAKVGFETGTSVLVGLSIKTVVATVGFLGYVWWRNAMPGWSNIFSNSLHWYVLAGIGNTTFLLAYYAALEIAPVVLVVPIMQISPLIVAVLSFAFLKRLENVTLPLVLSAVVVVVGAVLVSVHG